MKTLYIECNMGAAGDMLMAGLLELLPDKEKFLNKINNMGLNGITISAEKSVKCGITGTRVFVRIGEGNETEEEGSIDVDINAEVHEHHDHHNHEHNHKHNHEHEHEHHQNHSHRTLGDVEAIISGLHVSEGVKKNASKIYQLISEAEAHVHGCTPGEIHFHEVGSMDAIADIIGVCHLIEELAPEKIIASPVNVGSGFVSCSHGILPVPAPATVNILQGADDAAGIPFYSGNIKGELCTPTGAALLKHFAETFGSLPEMTVHKTGYGMGKKDFKAANCVRVFLGESPCKADIETIDEIAELCCNIDDMTGEAVGFACRTLLSAGAKDAFTTAAQMKKDRPGHLLTCICDAEKADFFAQLIFKHTSTFGIRKKLLSRYILERNTVIKETPFGNVRLKIGKGYGVEKNKLEYDDLADLAWKNDCSVTEMEHKLWKNMKN